MKRRTPEDDLQRDLVRLLRMPGVLREGVLFHHSPGESKGTPSWYKKRAAMGVLPGFPDLIFLDREPSDSGASCDLCCAWFIELKSKAGRLSPAQITVRASLEDIGAEYRVCRSVAEAMAALKEWELLNDRVEL